MFPASSVSMHVASAHSPGASQKSPLLSIDDVYKLAERTRMRTTLEARHLVLAQAQRRVSRDPGLSRPNTGALAGRGKRLPRPDTTGTASPSAAAEGREREKGPRPDTATEGEEEKEGGVETWGEEEPEVAVPPPLGFVRHVHISFRPRTFLTAYGDDDRHRLSLTRAHTAPDGCAGDASPGTGGTDAGTTCCLCHCNDVTFPCVCRDCRKLHTECVAGERMQTTFPALNLSEKHVTSSALVRRARPDMTPTEIQEKIRSGQIASSALIFPRHHGREKSDTDEEDEEVNDLHADSNSSHQQGSRSGNEAYIHGRHSVDGLPKRTSSPTKSASSVNSMSLLGKLKMKFSRDEATTPLYFTDLRHMNSKIFHGRTGRSLTAPGEDRRARAVRSDSKPLWPAFVSPRKCKLIEEPSNKAYFGPPLLTRRKQIPNPAFFAGCSDPYSLPERLPDILEFSGGKMAITDPNALVSHSSSSSSKAAQSPSTPAAVAVTDAAPPGTSASSAVLVTSESATALVTSKSTAGPAVSESSAAAVTSEANNTSSASPVIANADSRSTASNGAPGATSVPPSSGLPRSAASSADSGFATELSASSAAKAAAPEVAPTEPVVFRNAEGAVFERDRSADASPVTAASDDGGRSSVSGDYGEA